MPLSFLLLFTLPALAQVNSGKDCAMCHLDWVDSFKRPTGIFLMDKPEKSQAAEADMCLGCHDGSVADSRRLVWKDHSHQTGVAPPAGMTVPKDLPLENGKLVCRTCHSAHNAGQSGSLKGAFFIRTGNEQGQLCKACHQDKSKGPAGGSHPLVQMKTPLPASLKSAGARAGANDDLIMCQSCHGVHGGGKEHLLVVANNTNQLCKSCHEQMRPAMWDTNPAHSHPQNPPITKADQLQAIKDMKTQLGDGNTLVCLSCHKIHEAKSSRAILADTMQDSTFCIRCHQDRQTLLGSAHDMRKSAPQELNVRKETVAQSGACGSCHGFHNYARTPTPREGDPGGLCTTCHSDGQVAAKHSGLPMAHKSQLRNEKLPGDVKLTLYPATTPDLKAIGCQTCHNPHETKRPHFLNQPPEQICAHCHQELAQKLSKPHDFTGNNDLKNAKGSTVADAGRCGFCHTVHQAKGPRMWAATDQPFKTANDACTQCHSPQGIGHDKPLAKFNHPTGPDTKPKDAAANLGLPLYNPSLLPDPAGSVACSSCHDVHVGEKQSKSLLRASSPTALCIQCHSTQARMAGNSHDIKVCKKPFPPDAAVKNDLCLSCHRPHSNDEQKQRWAVAPAPGQLSKDGTCIACHQAEAWSSAQNSSQSGPMLHSQNFVIRPDVRKNPGLPLATPVAPDTTDKLLCKTCHDPHSPPGATGLLRVASGQSATDLCGKCHAEATYLQTTMHDKSHITKFITTQRGCAPCHSVHAVEGESRDLLWAAKKVENAPSPAARLCLGCHNNDKDGAPLPAFYKHPETTLKDLAKATTRPSTIIDHYGRIDQISCATCHIPHGRDMGEAATTSTDRGRVLSIKAMLRPNIDREVCAACHGIDGARRYLYFHDPKRRAQTENLIR
ncbi:MAG: cytochrome c3 family protein [Tepidisphaerales bacterium]